MKRAADVEEGLIFRRLSQGSDGDAGKLLADVVDLEGFEDRFRELQMPESNPVFAEDDDENMPESDPIFADDGEGEEKEETKELSGMAFLARTASAKALKRSLSAPAATANKVLRSRSFPLAVVLIGLPSPCSPPLLATPATSSSKKACNDSLPEPLPCPPSFCHPSFVCLLPSLIRTHAGSLPLRPPAFRSIIVLPSLDLLLFHTPYLSTHDPQGVHPGFNRWTRVPCARLRGPFCVQTFVEDTCTPAAAIAKMTAEALMKRTLSAVDRPSRPRRLSLTCDHDRMTSIKENAPEVAAVEGPGNQPEAKEEEVEEEEGPTSLIEVSLSLHPLP